MRFGVITAYPHADVQSRLIIAACARAGAVEVFAPTAFAMRVVGGGRAEVLAGGRHVGRIDAWLLPRALGRHGDPDFQCGVYRALSELGHPLLNPVDALLLAQDKVATSWRLARAGVSTPPVRAVQSLPEAEQALAELGPSVAKPPYGSLGIGVERIDPGPRARARLRALLAEHALVYLQRLAGRGGEDLRLFVVGRRVVAAIRRTAPAGEIASNAARGGICTSFRADAELARLAVRAAAAIGLHYAGVDVIEGPRGPTVIEVNGAPCWDSILRTTGRDMAPAIIAHATELNQQRSQRCRKRRPRAA